MKQIHALVLFQIMACEFVQAFSIKSWLCHHGHPPNTLVPTQQGDYTGLAADIDIVRGNQEIDLSGKEEVAR